MQSFLQYRKLRHAVRKQVQGDLEKSQFRPSHVNHPSEPPAPNAHDESISSSTPSPTDDTIRELEQINTTITVRTQYSKRTALGHSLLGIHARERNTNEGKGEKVFVVNWEGEKDPINPRNWSVTYRVWITLVVASISFVVGAASSADTAVLPQAAADFGVSDVVESMTIGR